MEDNDHVTPIRYVTSIPVRELVTRIVLQIETEIKDNFKYLHFQAMTFKCIKKMHEYQLSSVARQRNVNKLCIKVLNNKELRNREKKPKQGNYEWRKEYYYPQIEDVPDEEIRINLIDDTEIESKPIPAEGWFPHEEKKVAEDPWLFINLDKRDWEQKVLDDNYLPACYLLLACMHSCHKLIDRPILPLELERQKWQTLERAYMCCKKENIKGLIYACELAWDRVKVDLSQVVINSKKSYIKKRKGELDTKISALSKKYPSMTAGHMAAIINSEGGNTSAISIRQTEAWRRHKNKNKN